MSDLMEMVLQHRYIYLPRGTEKDTLELGKKLGLAVARRRRARLTVLSVQKSGATHHPELAKQTIVSERSGYIQDGGVVLVLCPRHKTMEKLHQLRNSVVVLVEWIPSEMEAWAKFNGAYNVVTGEIMEAGLSEDAIDALEAIVLEGYKGWTDDISTRIVRSHLETLQAAGAYDRNAVLAYARRTKHETSVQRLKRILDGFETKTSGPAGEFT